MKTKSKYILSLITLSVFYTYSQQGAYHDAMMEEQESGGQFGFIVGLIIVVGLIHLATKSD